MFSIFHRPTPALNQNPIANGNIPQREDPEYLNLPNQLRPLFSSGIHIIYGRNANDNFVM